MVAWNSKRKMSNYVDNISTSVKLDLLYCQNQMSSSLTHINDNLSDVLLVQLFKLLLSTLEFGRSNGFQLTRY
jgi:preprotein translocase subunit Sec63